MPSVPYVLLLLACSGSSEQNVVDVLSEPAKPNVVLVTMDTVRADRLGAYGYASASTSSVDALAKRGLRFERAYSPYPYTIPSHASLMTGLYPPQHQVRDNGDRPLSDTFDTLAEVLNDAGYATGASVAAFVTSRQWGFSQGFDVFKDEIPRARNVWHASRRGEQVVDDALAWAGTVPDDTPVFLWVHLYDAHLPLQPVEPYATRHAGRPYDAEIAYVDAQVSRLVEHFDTESTVFVITADHGESNGDHGERGHGLYVYDATQRVPLILAGPGVRRGVSDQLVSLVDVMPTILGLTGVDVPSGLAGRPVPSEDERPVYLESWQLTNRFGFAPHVAILEGDHKLIALPEPELYALRSDPGEVENLASTQPVRLAEMRSALEHLDFAPPSRGTQTLSIEVVQELEALGYLVGERPDAPLDTLPDPKNHAQLLGEIQRPDFGRLDDPSQLASLKKLVERHPDITELRIRLSNHLMKLGDLKQAEALVAAGIQRSEDPKLRTTMAHVLLAQKRFSDAADLLLLGRERQSYSSAYRVQLLRALLAAKRNTEAQKLAETWLAADPDDADVLGTLGVYLARSGRPTEAEPMLQRALLTDRPPVDVAFVLSMQAAVSGDERRAMVLLEQEVLHHPYNWAARSVLAARARDRGEWMSWKEHTHHMVQARADDVAAWRDYSQALFNLQDFVAARDAVDRALSLDPSDPNVVLLDANLMAVEGRVAEGRARFEEAKKLRRP